jgi:hypothetical protein
MEAVRGGARTGGLLGLLAGTVLLAGCAAAATPVPAAPVAATSAPASAAVRSAPAPSAQPVAGPVGGVERPADVPSGEPRCAPAQLEGRVVTGGAAAGHRRATLVVTNTSSHTCTLYGYGGAALYTASGVPIPTRLERVPEPGPSLVRLLPGGSAGKELRWGVVPSGDEPVDEPCQVPASEIRVIPPDETSPFWVVWDLGPVCDGGRIAGSAYHPVT